ncbi:hypothetical protein VSQ48_03030 [Candidatus Ventrimonas sp. KK005]
MNVNGIGAAGHLDLYGAGGIEKSVMERNFADEISKAAARLETDSGKAITKMRPMGDPVGETSELEDKYCSLCCSMIEEDGSCPMCGIPTFISGNGRSGNQKIAQEASFQAISGSPIIRSRVGRQQS